MRYHIKERAWSLTEAFVIRDESGNAAFEVRGKFFHIGDNLVMYDCYAHQEVAQIKQRLISLKHSYDIYRNREHWANVHEKLFHLFGERFKVEGENGMGFHIDGDIWKWNYTITDDEGNLLGQIGRQFSLFHDSYGVDIAAGVDVPFVLSLAIVIEMVKEHQADR